MSRPFSYNDENFTVIGNLLFCHIKVSSDFAGGDIVEIPPEIYKRLVSFSNVFVTSRAELNTRTASNIYIGIRLVNKRYVFFSGGTVDWKQIDYLYSVYLLKDI